MSVALGKVKFILSSVELDGTCSVVLAITFTHTGAMMSLENKQKRK